MGDGDHTTGVRSSVSEIADARKEASEYLAYARADSTLNTHEPAYDDGPVSQVHAAVFRYYDCLRPYRKGAPKVWNVEDEDKILGRFEYRAQGQLHTATVGDLTDLAQWRNREVVQYETTELNRRGASEEYQRVERRIYLPLTILQSAFDALSDAVVRADLGARLPEKVDHAEPL